MSTVVLPAPVESCMNGDEANQLHCAKSTLVLYEPLGSLYHTRDDNIIT